MASIKFSIRGIRPPTPIYIRFIEGKEQDFKIKTGLLINPKEWSTPNNFPKTTTAENKTLKAKLKDLEIQLFKDFNEAQQKGILITKDWLQFQIDLFFKRVTLNNRSEFLIDAVQEVIDTSSTKQNSKGGIGLSESRIKSYKGLKSILKDYCGTKQIKVKEIDVNFSNNFLHWLIEEKKYSKGSALKSIDNLKAVCKDAGIRGTETNNQLQHIKGGRIKNENVIYLTPTELEVIKNKELNSDKLENVRKWLLLGCNIGQRGGDLLDITIENFKTIRNLSVIELEQKKTHKIVLIPVNNQVKRILDSNLPYKISTQKFNENVKKLCEICEIDTPTNGSVYKLDENKTKRKKEGIYKKYELITSHVCRRSFCSNYYGKMPTNLIMQISGHSTEKMLLSYIGKKAPDYLQEIAHYFALEEQKQHKETNLTVIKESS